VAVTSKREEQTWVTVAVIVIAAAADVRVVAVDVLRRNKATKNLM
jgi:hypothetical protein